MLFYKRIFKQNLLLLCVLLCGNACTKTTSVSGKVLHAITREPMEGVPVGLILYDGVIKDSATPKVVATENTVSAKDGSFYLEASNQCADEVDLFVYNKNFCRQYFKSITTGAVHRNADNETDILVYPVDCSFKLCIENTGNNAVSITYQAIASPQFEVTACGLPLRTVTIQPQTIFTDSIKVMSGRYVPIFWEYKVFQSLNAAANKDSVLCKKGEQAVFKIKL